MRRGMDYILTKHARQRMEERGISGRLIKSSLLWPTEKVYMSDGRLLIKKLFRKGGLFHLLLISGRVISNGKIMVITVIETSNLKKYLWRK